MTLCAPWDLDTDCCELPDDTDEELIAKWQAVSSEVLWAASGRRIGTCETTVRPCLRRCASIGFGSPFAPYKGDDGEWRNFASCGCLGDCSCTALCEVVLDGPVAEVTQVLIGGDELMPDSYRLDLVGGQYRLLRTDGDCWPSCSDLTADCADEGAFCVTYLKGIEPSDLAIQANSALTCQLVKACLPDCECELPANVVSVVRRGVAITFDTSKAWLRTIPLVAAFLDAANPNDLQVASSVWTPDIPVTRVTPALEGS